MSKKGNPIICPYCGTKATGKPTCQKCGADLAPLMRTLALAHTLKKAAQEALAEDDFPLAAGRAAQARKMRADSRRRKLDLTARWLAERFAHEDDLDWMDPDSGAPGA